MKTSAAPANRSASPRRTKDGDALAFAEQVRTGTVASDLRARLEKFYQRYPRRPFKSGQRGIVESLKADRDRR